MPLSVVVLLQPAAQLTSTPAVLVPVPVPLAVVPALLVAVLFIVGGFGIMGIGSAAQEVGAPAFQALEVGAPAKRWSWRSCCRSASGARCWRLPHGATRCTAGRRPQWRRSQ